MWVWVYLKWGERCTKSVLNKMENKKTPGSNGITR